MITTLFFRKTATFNRILEMAEELHQTLSWAPEVHNGMDRIVEFFQTTSPYYDAFHELLSKQKQPFVLKDTKKQALFESLKKFIENTGRSEFGWNRTKKGEVPSAASTYINLRIPYDEMFFTKSVAEHLMRRTNPKGEVDYALKEEAAGKWNETGLIENEFVNPFIKGNYSILHEALMKYQAR